MMLIYQNGMYRISNVRNLKLIFFYTKYFIRIGLDIWNTSSVNDLLEIYDLAYNVNGNKSLWNVSALPYVCNKVC